MLLPSVFDTMALSHPVEGKKLSCCARRILGYRGFRQARPVAEKEADLNVAPDQPEKGTKGGFRVLEAKQAGVSPGLQHRLQALRHRKATILQHDGPQIVLARAGVPDGNAVESDGG